MNPRNQQISRGNAHILDEQALEMLDTSISPHLNHDAFPSPIPKSESNQEPDTPNQLDFLERDLSAQEIQSCELATHKYIQNDAYEIEIHNLNEINEYFRIFKDIIKRKDKQYYEEQDRLK